MTAKVRCGRCEAGDRSVIVGLMLSVAVRLTDGIQFGYHSDPAELCPASLPPETVQAIEKALLARVRKCEECHGIGKILCASRVGSNEVDIQNDECDHCGGRGFVVAEANEKVKE